MISGTCSRSACATAGPAASQSTQPISGIAQIRRVHIMFASFRDADWRRISLTDQGKFSPNRLLRGIGRSGLDVRRASHFGLDGRARIAGQLIHVGQQPVRWVGASACNPTLLAGRKSCLPCRRSSPSSSSKSCRSCAVRPTCPSCRR
jgi:hypothetical protein